MRLLSVHDGQLRLVEYTRDIPAYSVISHRWFDDEDEVTFKDMVEGTGKSKPGYRKIQFCEERNAINGISHFWIDTCCIDKTNNTELSEAINSMFRWYRRAAKCYVYLSDVAIDSYNPDQLYTQSDWELEFRNSNWWTRGWTLQELIAPTVVEFYTTEGLFVGDKSTLEDLINDITNIPVAALRGGALSDFSVEERMSWAAHRQTKREEDKYYSLFGIFDIYLPPIYGEGQQRALYRVRREVAELERQNAQYLLDKSFSIHVASKNGDIRSLKEHLQYGTTVDVHDTDQDGRTALHFAKTARTAELLIDAGALVNQPDKLGVTPLHRAVEERRLDVVKKLLSRSAKTTEADHSGKLPIDLAEDCPAAAWMLEHGCRRDGLLQMAWLGDIEGVSFFLSQGSDVDKRNPLGETALTEASRHGDTEVVKLLLEAGADTEVKTRKGGWSPLLLAVTNNRQETVEALVLADAKLTTTENRNHDALTEAVYKGHWDIARILIEHGAEVNTADHRGNTPLHCSAHRADPDFTQFLVERGAFVDAVNIFGGTALLETILHHPSQAQNHVRILLNNGASADISNHEGYSPLSMAARVGNENVIKLLLKHVQNPSLASNASRGGAFSWTPLAEACFNIYPGCVRLLLEAGVDTELRNADDWHTPLHLVVQRAESSAETVRLLIDHGANVEATDKSNYTTLQLAVRSSSADVIKALLDAGANPNICSQDGNPPEGGYNALLLAVHANNKAAVKILIESGIELEAYTAEKHYTALMLAAKHKRWDLVTILMQSGANVNTCDVAKTTPLMEAAKAGEKSIISSLIQHGANRRLRDSVGRTAWIWAKHQGRGKEFEMLIDSKSK